MILAEITDKELIKHLSSIEKDGMTLFSLENGLFRGAFYNGTRMVNQMRANHNLGILETMVLGQAELCAALLIPLMKGREHVTFLYKTDGAAEGFSVESDSTGYVRGHLLQNIIPVEKPLENWDLSPFFGNGTVTISRMSEGMKQPQSGTTEIKYHNIAKDLTWYFSQSEQINTAFNTGIQFDRQGRVTGAGGLFLQAVPDTGGYKSKGGLVGRTAQTENKERSSNEIDKITTEIENAFQVAPSLGQWFAENGNRNDIIMGLFRKFKPTVLLERDVIFGCPCSAENFAQQIRSMGKENLNDIIKNDPDPIEVVCRNCGSAYYITKQMLKEE
jgi:molecular chaperone Hsp33